ncbi:EAL domain-containing protein [Marinomonas sp. IMCC 4694]|uniref:sensor domain-containing protein n=1 Tax=Marinomonas sp. IMCC 4694 TaxID=2605432 RepID=UPI0011E7AB84|nr:EAL domain-containing protein [Marinomonas sp. IMCC 4694]TYL47450.1 EAL domain-containing protein [Marinomonas sp. IMCC 4694]
MELKDETKKPIPLLIRCIKKKKLFIVSHSKHIVDNKVTFFFTFSPLTHNSHSKSEDFLYKQAFESSNQSIYLTDCNHNILFVNPSFTHFFGRDYLDIKDKKDDILYHHSSKKLHDEAIESLINEVDHVEERMTCTTAFDNAAPVICNVNIVMVHDDESHNFLHFVEDITKQVTAEESMKDVAFKDPLTGIANRHSFNVTFKEQFEEAQRQGEQLSIFFIDLDKFKYLNDQYGHEYGDLLLTQAAERLNNCSMSSDFVARLGGDEFVVLIPGNQPKSNLESVARRILSEFSRPFTLKDLEYKCTCCIGIAQYPDDSMSKNSLLNAADSAMYIAKRSGRNDFAFYNYEKQKITNQHEHRFKEIEQAVEKSLVHLYFQPIHDMVTGDVVSFEALARYINEEGILQPPSYFLPYIESDPIIHKLGVNQIREIKRYLKVLKYHGVHLPISVNLSSYQVKSDAIIKELELIAESAPDIVRLLKIEVTETMLFESDSIAIKNLNHINKLGYSLVLDDFGTGHSSIYSLKKINFEIVKIDKIFIEEIKKQHENERKFLNAIIAMIQNLNAKIICEGIENKEQVDYLLQRGCNIGQGYYYSKAIPRNDILNYLGI